MNSINYEFKLGMLGQMQRAATIFSFSVFSALLKTLGADCFLYKNMFLLFLYFATFLILSGIFGILYGFVFLPALSAQFGLKYGDNLSSSFKMKCFNQNIDDDDGDIDDIDEDTFGDKKQKNNSRKVEKDQNDDLENEESVSSEC